MPRRPVYPAIEAKAHAGCVATLAVIALVGVSLTMWLGWYWAVVLAVPGTIGLVVILKRAAVVASARAYLRDRGAVGILVYSDSPNWKPYIEERWLPVVGSRLLILNWSERRTWDPTPEIRLFHAFTGDENFNPVAILLTRRHPLVFEFHSAFKNAKHGNTEGVEMLQRQLFDELNSAPA